MSDKKPLKCPLCGGIIKKLSGDTPLIKCENNKYENGQQKGCTFYMNLSPKPLSGYIFSRKEVEQMINGQTVEIEGIKARYSKLAKFNPLLEFPPLEDF